MDPDQTAGGSLIWSILLFAIQATKVHRQMQEQKTKVVTDSEKDSFKIL